VFPSSSDIPPPIYVLLEHLYQDENFKIVHQVVWAPWRSREWIESGPFAIISRKYLKYFLTFFSAI